MMLEDREFKKSLYKHCSLLSIPFVGFESFDFSFANRFAKKTKPLEGTKQYNIES